MSKKQLVIQHDLSKLDAPALAQYLRDVSEFIGLDPDLNALDTIWMQNENGPGQSLVVYARRGTAEILRNKLGIEVVSLTHDIMDGSMVFTATGKGVGTPEREGRQEIAVGSKYIKGLQGKALDDAIMTASTRALRRLTMQFTTLGLLDESEVKSTVGDTANPAAGAALAGSPTVIPWMPVPLAPNNSPGKDVTTVPALPAEPVILLNAVPGAKPTMQEMRGEATRFLAAKTAAVSPAVPPSSPVETPQNTETTSAELRATSDAIDAAAAVKPKRARKPKNSVSLETSGPEPETVTKPDLPSPGALALAPINPNTFAPVFTPLTTAVPPAASVVEVPAIPAQLGASLAAVVPPAAPVAAAPVSVEDFAGKPSVEQMADYRKKVSVFTSQLPSSENLGSVQKMRAFITKMSGTAPQFMTVDQWEETLGWFTEFSARNQIKGLVTYINDTLGVK
jgi:hypothetical protein